MGCDIHFYVEKKVNGIWETADTWEEDEGRFNVPYKKAFYSNRNYELFGILADVRNGRGFAGVDTGDGFIPIAEPRGVPNDANSKYKGAVKDYGEDGHSHSYFTLAELLAYDWTQETKLRGVVDLRNFGRIIEDGEPKEYCGDIHGSEVKKVTPADMALALGEYTDKWGIIYHKDPLKPEHEKLYCHAQWTRKYYECATDLFGETIPQLLALGAPDDVRIVFFFDN